MLAGDQSYIIRPSQSWPAPSGKVSLSEKISLFETFSSVSKKFQKNNRKEMVLSESQTARARADPPRQGPAKHRDMQGSRLGCIARGGLFVVAPACQQRQTERCTVVTIEEVR